MNLLNIKLQEWLSNTCQFMTYEASLLPQDASLRRYFRIKQANQSFILMDASKEQSSCLPYVAISEALRKKGLETPEVFACDFLEGFLLLSDFGDDLYLQKLNDNNADDLYTRAIVAINSMQTCKIVPGWRLPLFTNAVMRKELDLFQEWFLAKHLQLTSSSDTQIKLNVFFDKLIQSIAQQPYVFMHRDYHSANLMVLPNKKIGILDFQDAFLGPMTYDLVSLLRDCYVAWPENWVYQKVKIFWENLCLNSISFEEFIEWFDLMGMQRHMKALMTFSRKFHRDQNSNYLKHIPRTLNYLLTVSERYAISKPFHFFLKEVKEKCEQ